MCDVASVTAPPNPPKPQLNRFEQPCCTSHCALLAPPPSPCATVSYSHSPHFEPSPLVPFVAQTTTMLLHRQFMVLEQKPERSLPTNLSPPDWTVCRSSVSWKEWTFSTSSPWIRVAWALLLTRSRFSQPSVFPCLPCHRELPHPFLQDTERIVGCTGSPADSHDLLWFNVTTEKPSRCPECGSGTSFDFSPPIRVF